MIVLIVVGSLLLVLMSAIISSQFLTPYVPLISPAPIAAGYIGYYAGILCLFVIPILLLGKWLINYTFGYRSNSQFRKIMSGFWLVSLVAFVGTVIFSSKNFVANSETSELTLSSDIDTLQTLMVNFHSLQLENRWQRLRFGPVKLENGNLYAENVAIDIKFSANDSSQLEIDKNVSSYGRNKKKARRNTSFVEHNIELKGQVLDIDMFYTIPKHGKFRVQELDYNISLPVGTKIKFNEVPRGILHGHIFKLGTGANYRMTDEGLKVIRQNKDS